MGKVLRQNSRIHIGDREMANNKSWSFICLYVRAGSCWISREIGKNGKNEVNNLKGTSAPRRHNCNILVCIYGGVQL